MSMGLEDCKVFIHSVDAQSSIAGGIIIQVIGEMSNRGEAWRKFAQTFFLAEQPKGYYILNDIFRYLKEESVEDDEVIEGEDMNGIAAPSDTHEQAAPAVEAPHPEPIANIPTQTMEVDQESVHEPAPAPEPEAVPEEPPITKPQPNGVHEEPATETAEPAVETPTVPEPAQERAPTPAAAPAHASPSPAPAQAAAQQPAAAPAEKPAVQQAPTPPQQQQQPAKPAEPEKPAGPRTWANLAALNSKKWSSALATESRGMSVEAAPSPPPAAAPSRNSTQTGASTPPQTSGPPQGQPVQRNVREIATSLTRGDVFVKGLVDPMTNQDLENLLSKYGKIKSKEFVRNRAIAFFEFEDVESARAAIIDSGNVGNGGNGGIFFYPPNSDRLRIVVDLKREKGDKERPPARPRQGGIPNQPSSERGGFRGGGRGGTRGRGVPAGK